MTEHILCQLHEIPLPGSRGFDLDGRAVFVVRHESGVFAYQNQCPHLGVELEWVDHQFLDSSLQYIQCATHGALFQPHDGRCVSGPCVGDALKPLDVSVCDGQVRLYLP